MKRILLLVSIFAFILSGQSYAGDNMVCKNDADCPDGYVCKKATYRMMGSCLEEPKPETVVPIYPVGFISKITRDTIDKYLSMPIPFKDDNLKRKINKELGEPASSDITVEECMELEQFSPGSEWNEPEEEKIKDLYGIQFCFNLTHLYLPSQMIKDISPIATLTKLQAIDFSYNEIKSLNPVKDLTNLQHLNVVKNEIENINPPLFANLPLTALNIANNPLESLAFLNALQFKLKSFSISRGNLSDTLFTDVILDKLSPDLSYLSLHDFDMSEKMGIIAGFTGLKYLTLVDANIDDISSLSTLENLHALMLTGNHISDLNPLIDLAELKLISLNHNNINTISALVTKAEMGLFEEGANIYLYGNPLLDGAFEWHVEILESFGIGVVYD